MSRHYPDIAAIDAEHHGPFEQATVTRAYEVGLLALPAWRQLLAYARTFVNVEDFRAGGWVQRRGYLKVSGQWISVRRFLRLWDRMAAENPPKE